MEILRHIDTTYELKDTLSFLNTKEHHEETIATIDFENDISVDIQFTNNVNTPCLKMFIFLRSGEGDYCSIDGNFYSIQECVDYFKGWSIEDLNEELN